MRRKRKVIGGRLPAGGVARPGDLQAILEVMPDAVVVVGQDGKIVMVNSNAERLFSHPRQEMVGQPVEMLVPDDLGAAHERHRERYWAWPDIRPMGVARELLAKRGDGTTLPVEISLSTFATGSGRLVLADARDVSRAQRAWAELVEAHATVSGQLAELENRHQGLLRVNKLSELLQAVESEDEIHRVVTENGSRLFPRLAGRLFLWDVSRTEVVLVATWGDSATLGPFTAPGECWAMGLGRPCGSRYPDDAPRCPHVSGPGDYLCIPLVSLDQTLGVLHLGVTGDGDGRPIDEADEALATTMMGSVASSLSSFRLRQALESEATRDSLSGLFNRRYMEWAVNRELKRAARYGRPLGFMLLDIDDFKGFNDTYGHDAADSLLRDLARLLERNVRAQDVVCRYGGDEVVLVLPDTPPEGCAAKADALRGAVAQMKPRHLGGTLPSVTVQVGTSVYPDDGDDLISLFRAADSALLRAKGDRRASLSRVTPTTGSSDV